MHKGRDDTADAGSLIPPEDRTTNVTPPAAESATNHDDPGQADHPETDHLVQPSNAPPRKTLQQRPAGKASTYPARATGTQGVDASLGSSWCQTRRKNQRPLPTSPGRGPHFPDPRDPPATGNGGSATPGPVIPPDPPLPRNRSARGRAKEPAKRAGPTAELMTTGALSNTAIRQMRALALGERRQRATRTETEARMAHPALVHEIFSTPRGTLVRRVGNPPGP